MGATTPHRGRAGRPAGQQHVARRARRGWRGRWSRGPGLP